MNEYVSEDSVGLEVGCGTGVSKEFIKAGDIFQVVLLVEI